VIQYDVLGCGVIAVDDLLFVDAYPPADEKTRVAHSERQGGGLTATALIAAARLGSQCAYAGALGSDPLSQFAIERFEAEGVDVTHLCHRPDARPGHSIIVVGHEGGTRNIFYSGDGVVACASDWPPEEVVLSARVLFVDSAGLEGQVRVATIARRAGIPVVADLEGGDSPLLRELMGLVDHLIIPVAFARALTGEADAEAATRALLAMREGVVVVTDGAVGAWFGEGTGSEASHQPAFQVDVVDTTGCGDVFHGAYASALARGLGLDDRVRFAAAVAAIKATRRGGQSGIPDRPTVEAFLQQAGQ
jgi:sulfofructose kinase